MIALREVTFRYGDAPVLSDVSLEIPDGQFLLLVGENGTGKTTLLRQCNGLLTPDSGEVLVNGRAVGDDLVAARTAVGMVFQEPGDGFVAATVREDVAFGPENLGLPREEVDRRVERALSAVRLGGRGAERIQELSGGEQARVAVAGALAMEPDHLLLDEPLGGLDDRSRRAVVDRLVDLHGAGTSVVVATHDLRDVMEPAERVVGLSDGRIALDGPPSAVADRLSGVGVRRPC